MILSASYLCHVGDSEHNNWREEERITGLSDLKSKCFYKETQQLLRGKAESDSVNQAGRGDSGASNELCSFTARLMETSGGLGRSQSESGVYVLSPTGRPALQHFNGHLWDFIPGTSVASRQVLFPEHERGLPLLSYL